jgi:hypothetical protein
MNKKTTLIIGAILLAIGYYMHAAKAVRQETRFRDVTSTTSTKGRNAAVGGGVGAVVGGGGAAVVGGVGVAACGTGFGLPAGLLLIGIAALVGGGAGATIGAATGKTTTVVSQVPYNVQIVEPAYSHDVSLAVIVLGSLIVIWVIGSYLKQRTKNRANPSA